MSKKNNSRQRRNRSVVGVVGEVEGKIRCGRGDFGAKPLLPLAKNAEKHPKIAPKNTYSVRDIYALLDAISPFNLQESWDNSGLIVGDFSRRVGEITLCLDVDLKIAQEAPQNSLIIAHHPLIFSPLKRLIFSDYPSNILEVLLQKNIALIALHTNFDATHLNEFFTREVLGFENFEKRGLVCVAKWENSLNNLAQSIKTRLKMGHLRVSSDLGESGGDFGGESSFETRCESAAHAANPSGRESHHIAILCGSGLSEILREISAANLPANTANPAAHATPAAFPPPNLANIDCIITGDLKHHDAVALLSRGISFIDVGHFESERAFGRLLGGLLQNEGVVATIADSKNPFSSL